MSNSMPLENFRYARLFRALSDDILTKLAEHSRELELHAGESLFLQDDPGDAMYILLDGQIHVVRSYPSGEEVVLATEGPYYVIGELSMLSGQPRTGAVEAVSDCTLIAIDRATFLDVCEQVPGAASSVLNYLAERLYRMNLLVREQAIGNIAARVASLLLLAAGESGMITGPPSPTRIARAVAIDAEAVERILKEWTGAGYITLDRASLTINDMDALKQLAG